MTVLQAFKTNPNKEILLNKYIPSCCVSVQWQVTGTSKCCFGGPFLGLFTDPNDREYPPPSTTTVGVAHESQASVSLMFLPHFDVFRDLFLEQTHSNMESIRLYHKQIDKRTWYRLTVPGFVLVFPRHKRCFLPLLLLFSFILLVDSFSQTCWNALTPHHLYHLSKEDIRKG